MKGLLLAAASSLLCVAAVTVVFCIVDVRRRAAAMLRIFLATIPLYVAAYALTPADLWLLPERLVEPRSFLCGVFGLFVHAALFFGGWLQVYNLAFLGYNLGKATALAVVLFFVIMTLVVLQRRYFRESLDE